MFKYVERPSDQPVDCQVELSVSSPLEVVCNVRLLLRIQGFFDVLGETEREELAELVRQQVCPPPHATIAVPPPRPPCPTSLPIAREV